MKEIIFADESGTDNDSSCYSIGAVIVQDTVLDGFNNKFYELKKRYNIQDEIKWSKIRTNYGAMNFVLDWFHLLVNARSASFRVIVVNKSLYRNWSGNSSNKERAFYVTYTQLLHDKARQSGKSTYDVYIDHRTDTYNKQHEVVQIITNHMLAQVQKTQRINLVEKTDSKLLPGIQVADLLTGAINTGHRLYLESDLQINAGKRLLLSRIADLLGWDLLCYDTYPQPKFNIWHFPKEYRAMPGTREIHLKQEIPYITRTDIENIR